MAFSFKLFHTLGLDSLGKGVKPGLSRNEVYALPIAIPPLAEQHRIVAKVDELMALCDQLEVQLNTTEADSHRLLEAVLHEALSPALEESA
jgi:type I restriction enzyme S subunit